MLIVTNSDFLLSLALSLKFGILLFSLQRQCLEESKSNEQKMETSITKLVQEKEELAMVA